MESTCGAKFTHRRNFCQGLCRSNFEKVLEALEKKLKACENNFNFDFFKEKSPFSSRIDTAMNIDNLQPLDKDSHHSSSAIDVLMILHHIKQFWESVKLPTPENTAEYSQQVVSSCLVYLYNIVERAVTLEPSNGQKLPKEVSVVANNINFIVKGVEKMILDQPSHLKENCQLQKVVTDFNDHADSRTKKLMQSAVKRLTPKLEKLLLESVDKFSDENSAIDAFTIELQSVYNDFDAASFEVFKFVLWESMLDFLSHLVQTSVKNQRQKIFFRNLRAVFQALQKYLMNGNENIGIEKLLEKTQQLDFTMERHGMETSELIHQYYKDRYQKQQSIKNTNSHALGSLSIFCHFEGNVLKVEVLNAKHLISPEVKRMPTSFVKIKFISSQNFPDFPKCKTATHPENKFPLYDERFEL